MILAAFLLASVACSARRHLPWIKVSAVHA
jgi:hypothetical protein